MAQGKISNRQKMINLMYLVFIAMLAMNIDREVLRSFASTNQTIEEVVVQTMQTNGAFYGSILDREKSGDIQAKEARIKADTLRAVVADFNKYIQNIKNKISAKKINVDDAKLDYKSLEASEKLNKYFFYGGHPTKEAKEFQQKVESFRNFLLSFDKIDDLDKTRINKFFNTANQNGKTWLKHKFYNQPAVASLTNLSSMQMTALNEENKMLFKLANIKSVAPISVDITSISSVYSVNPNTSTYNQQEDYKHQTNTTGSAKVIFESRVVYVGYDNPINPAGAGSRPETVKASTSNGQLIPQGDGGFIYKPTSLGTATVNVSCQNVNGQAVTGVATYQVKPVPPATGIVRGQSVLRLPASSVAGVTVEMTWKDFMYPITANVTSFDVKIPGKVTFSCTGNRMSAEARAALSQARPGDKITIFNIKGVTDKGAQVKGTDVVIAIP